LSEAELKNAKPQRVKIKLDAAGVVEKEVALDVLLRARALPQ
jgi:hypothetical protein